MNRANQKDVKEVKAILKDLKGEKSSKCPDEKDMLTWTAKDLKDYIFIKTRGMSISNKFKFGHELDKKIKEAKLKAKGKK
jgi:hypothetical protein